MARNNKVVDIVVPVYNEEVVLKTNIRKLAGILKNDFQYKWRIIIADSGSSDNTSSEARKLMAGQDKVSYLKTEKTGRGRVLKKAWSKSNADIVCYMDADLSTDLKHLQELIDAVAGEYDVAVGSRLMKGAEVERSILRELFSRSYNWLVKLWLPVNELSDVQCGFKALKADCAKALLPEIKSDEWFFDTELLVLAKAKGYSIKQIPVMWTEKKDSRVNVVKAVIEDITGIIRLKINIKKNKNK